MKLRRFKTGGRNRQEVNAAAASVVVEAGAETEALAVEIAALRPM